MRVLERKDKNLYQSILGLENLWVGCRGDKSLSLKRLGRFQLKF